MCSYVISMPKLTVSSLLNQLRADLRGDTERGKLVRSAGLTAGMKIGTTLLAFGASLLYARALGPHDYGLYAYVIAWTAILTIPAGLGLPQYLVREGTKIPESLDWLRRWADKRVLVAGSLAGILLACAVFIPTAAGARWLFVISAPLPLLSNLAAVRRSLLQAHGWIAHSQWPQLLLAPAIMLATLAGLWLWRNTLYSFELIVTTVAVATLPILINGLQLRRIARKFRCDQQTTVYVRSALPFMWLGGMYLLVSRTDLIMLGAMKGARDAGVYAVASRAAELIPFFMTAATTSIAPKIAKLHYAGEDQLLQRMLTGTARRVLLVSTPLALLLIFAANPLLYYLYGTQYIDGAIVLQILAFAQLFVVLGGPLGTILDMTGREQLNVKTMAVTVLVNIILNLALIPRFGAQGAAIATCVSMILARSFLWYLVRSRFGLRPSGLGH